MKFLNWLFIFNFKSFSRLFSYCGCIESIKFKKFYRNNVTNMSGMFGGCLDELKLKIKSQLKNFKEEAFKN